MFIVLLVTVPLALFLVWAVAADLTKRRQSQQLNDHNARQVARETRIQAEGLGSEWGGPGF